MNFSQFYKNIYDNIIIFYQVKLYNSHNICAIRFYPQNGDLLAGGSNSGQLILWNLEDYFQTSCSPAIQETQIIREFMVNQIFENFLKISRYPNF